MKSLYSIFLFLIIFSVALRAQRIERTQYLYNESNQVTLATRYDIYNDTEEEMLTWIAYDQTNGLPDTYRILNNIPSNLLDSIFRDKIDSCGLCEIGKSFMKNIRKGMSFSYIITGCNDESASNAIADRFIVVPRKNVELLILTHLQDEWFYDKNEIVDNAKNIIKKCNIKYEVNDK